MRLQKLKLKNFRTYDDLELEFDKNINVFVGNNAEGKTNILESIYISCITKSYRTIKDMECISFNRDFLRIENNYIDINNNEIQVEVFIDNNGKKIFRENGIKVDKYSDFLGKIPIVMFSPDNMNIIKGSPKERRKFLDILISQTSKKYVIYLQEYNKLIQIRNNLLKNDKNYVDINYLDILDEKISEKIEYICNKRYEFVNYVEKEGKKIQKELSNNKENLEIIYDSEFLNKNKEEIKNMLFLNRDLDFLRKTSNKTIGHDDLIININDKEVSKFGSQGQKRTALLSIKLAEFEILKNKKDNTPIILLDDVFSELDIERINYLLKYVSKFQVFITTTDIEPINNLEDKAIFEVKKGLVKII